MTPVLEQSEEVFCDLQVLSCHFCGFSADAAHRFLTAARQEFEFIATNPELGRLRPEFGHEGLRSRPLRGHRKHLVFYFTTPERVRIWRLLHGARDLGSILGA